MEGDHPALGGLGIGEHLGRLAFASSAEVDADRGTVEIAPGGPDEHASDVRVARLHEEPLPTEAPLECCSEGTRTGEGHER